MKMQSWPFLPDAPLRTLGADSRAFLRLGCGTFRSAARYLHELPYGRNADRSDFRLVLPAQRGTCSTKHALLASVAREQSLPVGLTIGIYDMCEGNTPGVGRVLALHGLESLPEAHCYLSYADDRVDITRSGVSPREPITRFHQEWTIEPSGIGAHKAELHEQHLRAWLRQRSELGLTFEELWRIRESCILALGSS
jgi:hypothetical protein